MPDISAILGLPYLLPSQAQKHVTHNEALRLLDILVQLRVIAFDASTPPAAPAEGEVHALGAAPTGAWAGQANRLAAFAEGVWTFVAPLPGWRAWDSANGELRIWDGAAWGLPVPALDNVTKLGIQTSADATNRLSVASDAALFSHDGAGHQLKINKAGDTDTASLLFQSNFTGHAEIGLAGDTGLAVKVSDDGSSWAEALAVDAASGAVALPQGLTLGGGADLLDIYETGSWTPEVGDAESGGNAGTASTATGRYTRIGNHVRVNFVLQGIDTTGLAAGNVLYIRALPFSANSHSSSRFTSAARVSNVTFANTPFFYLSAGGSALRLMQNVSGASSVFLDVSDFASGSAQVYGSISYRV